MAAIEPDKHWTPLMRAVAQGSIADVEREIAAGGDLETRDRWCRSPFALALIGGDLARAQLLFDRGANADVCGAEPPLFYAIDGHHRHVVEWLLGLGADVNQADHAGRTALMHAADEDDVACADALIAAGADVDRDVFGTALSRARGRAMVERLLAAGADPVALTDEGRRALLGLPPDPDERLMTASPEEFRRASTRRFGSTNPEPMSEPFWVAMVRSGLTAYAAGQKFGGSRACGREPIWCARRFGQSVTRLPDGYLVLIGGEHEDFYDPDFCIYNDVIVVAPDGAVTIYGYPEDVFPPTDFHTATLVDGAIYIIGALGYQGTRRAGETPVYRLDAGSFRVDRVELGGDAPGWIYGHRAELVEGRTIRVRGGTIVTQRDGREQHEPNQKDFGLDVRSGRW